MNRPTRRVVASTAFAVTALLAMPSKATARPHPPQVLLGVSFADVTGMAATNLGVDWRFGFTAGADFAVPIGSKDSKVSFHPEALFTMKGVTTVGSMTFQTRLNYVEVPALVRLDVRPRVSKDAIGLDVVAGPVFAFNLTATSENPDTKFTSSLRDQVNRMDVGLMFGADVEVWKGHLDVGARLELGLRPIFNSAGSKEKNLQLLILVTPHLVNED